MIFVCDDYHVETCGTDLGTEMHPKARLLVDFLPLKGDRGID